ncbi:DUF5131 family protein [Paenibacillus bouchesdurhonensis]|uniref:DUF5131 family protein n=1 Tax=Paenibacillus bouchesdurhonensis TaxID=1870990 RepID=UPI000DA62A23|nr:phage Gp37/Gp68 family protein [Paenibacillus bouchesdurhonensis]
MSDKTGIEWADATWNPVTGCTKVSEGCRNCYAKTFTERFEGTPGHYFESGFHVTLRPEKLDQPLRWKRPRRIFVNSMSDLFHPDVPDGFIEQVFRVMTIAQHHTYQILTKRPERMRDWILQRGWIMSELPHVWLGVSVENQKAADERIPHLLQIPAVVRFLSCEPLLGPVDLSKWMLTPGWTPSYYDPDNIHGYPNAEPTNEYINFRRDSMLDFFYRGSPHAVEASKSEMMQNAVEIKRIIAEINAPIELVAVNKYYKLNIIGRALSGYGEGRLHHYLLIRNPNEFRREHEFHGRDAWEQAPNYVQIKDLEFGQMELF